MKNRVLLRGVDDEPGLDGVVVNSDEPFDYSRSHGTVGEWKGEVVKVCPRGIVPGDTEDKVDSGDYKRWPEIHGIGTAMEVIKVEVVRKSYVKRKLGMGGGFVVDTDPRIFRIRNLQVD